MTANLSATTTARRGEPAPPPGSPGVPGTPSVRLEGITKRFGDVTDGLVALDGFDLEVARGELVCLVGASGCGKTTLLNLLAGLDRPTAGHLEARGRVSLMFQEAALFPWLTVAGNISLALKLRGVPRRERPETIKSLLHTVRLDGFGAHRPFQLSGGMRQRVALARALAQDADILLMDEPFGALDAMTRDILHDELERLWDECGFTCVFVTHNVREAARLADRIVLLSSRPGRVIRTYDVDLPRPRRIESPDVGALAGEITTRLREEVRRHATDR